MSMARLKLLLCAFCALATGSAAPAAWAHPVDVTFERDSSLPLVYLNVAVKTGAVSDPRAELGLTNFVGQMLLRGTTERNKEEIDLALDQMGAQLEVETRLEAMIFRGAVLSSQLDPFLALMREILTRPSFPGDQIQSLKSEVESEILEEHSTDERLAGLAFASFLFDDHPYGKPVLGKVKTVSTFTRDELLDQYRELFNDRMLLVVGSGDASPSKIKDWAGALEDNLPDKAPHPLPEVPPPVNPRGMRLLIVDKPDRTQTQIIGGQVGIKMTSSDFFPLYLGNEVFGGESFSSRMMHEIRDERGWSYGAYSYFKHAREPRDWQFYLFPAEQDTPAALAYAIGMVRSLQANGVTQSEFNYEKRMLVSGAGFLYNTPAKRVENALDEKILGLPRGFVKSYGPELEKVTLNQTNAALKKFLRPDDLSIVVVGTARKLRSKLARAVGIPAPRIQVIPYGKE